MVALPYWQCPTPEIARFSHSRTAARSSSSLDAASVQKAVAGADYVIMVVDNAKDGGGEGHDRYTISLSAAQIAM